jgi:hypothetical protein
VLISKQIRIRYPNVNPNKRLFKKKKQNPKKVDYDKVYSPKDKAIIMNNIKNQDPKYLAKKNKSDEKKGKDKKEINQLEQQSGSEDDASIDANFDLDETSKKDEMIDKFDTSKNNLENHFVASQMMEMANEVENVDKIPTDNVMQGEELNTTTKVNEVSDNIKNNMQEKDADVNANSNPEDANNITTSTCAEKEKDIGMKNINAEITTSLPHDKEKEKQKASTTTPASPPSHNTDENVNTNANENENVDEECINENDCVSLCSSKSAVNTKQKPKHKQKPKPKETKSKHQKKRAKKQEAKQCEEETKENPKEDKGLEDLLDKLRDNISNYHTETRKAPE